MDSCQRMPPRVKSKNHYAVTDDGIEIYLSKNAKEYVARCDLEDEPMLEHIKWRINNGGYLIGYTVGKDISFHRAIVAANDGETIDHINRDRLDNRRENLRSRCPRVQNINRILNHGKNLPPGIAFDEENRCYRTTCVTDEKKKMSRNYSEYVYGEKRALWMAMYSRMIMIHNSQDYLDSLFPEDRIKEAIASLGGKYGGDTREGLRWLSNNGYNLWNIPYDGAYAHLNEPGEWRESDYVRDLKSRIQKSFDWIHRYYSGEDRLDKYEEFYVAICETCADVAPGEDEVVTTEGIPAEFGTIPDSSDAEFSQKDFSLARPQSESEDTSAMTQFVPTESDTPEPSHMDDYSSDSKAIQKESPVSVRRSASSDIRKLNRVLADTPEPSYPDYYLSSSSSEPIGKLNTSALDKAVADDVSRDLADNVERIRIEALEKGKTEEYNKVMGRAIKAASKAITPIEEPVKPKKPRYFKPDPHDSVKEWTSEHLEYSEGSLILSSDALSRYTQWFKDQGIGMPNGSTRFAHFMKELGYVAESKKVFMDVGYTNQLPAVE